MPPASASTSTPVQTYNLHPSTPTLRLPAGACDTHCHVFGPAADYPFAPGRQTTPADAPRSRLFELHKKLGISHCVVVQTVLHGFDNRVVEDTIRAGEGRYLGIALTPLNVADAELKRLAAAGFRGIRFNFVPSLSGGVEPAQLEDFSRRLAPLGLHLQVHYTGDVIHTLAPALRRCAVPVVIDHMGRVDATLGTAHADIDALHALMRDERFAVKVSGIDRVSPAGDYSSGIALARHLLAEFPGRCFWGSDWPHPNHHHVPDDGVLVDAIAAIAPTPELLARLMVDNPRAFYQFPDSSY